jgi:hypothetical protein
MSVNEQKVEGEKMGMSGGREYTELSFDFQPGEVIALRFLEER